MRDITKKYLMYGSYDFSNSGYVLIFQSFLFPIVLSSVATTSNMDINKVWAGLITISSILAVAGSPFLGKLGDKIGKGKIFTSVVIFTGILAFLSSMSLNIWILLGGFLIFNTLFEFSQNIYDSFLRVAVQDKKVTTSLSSFAWGMGYVGGALFAGIYFFGQKSMIPDHFLLAGFALLYLVFSVPSLLGFQKLTHTNTSNKNTTPISALLHPKNPVPWAHLFIYWIIADCITASVYFVPLYLQQSMHLETKVVGIFLLVAQVIAFPATILMGKLANTIGRIRTIQISLFIWCIALLLLFFAKKISDLIPIMLLISCVIGSTQAVLRAHFVTRISVEKAGEGVGFYAIAQKSASIISPILILGIITLFGSLKPTFLILIILVGIGIFLAPRLNEKQ